MRTILLATVAAAALAGCANPYADFYRGAPDARVLAGYDGSETGVKIFTSDNIERDRRALIRKGYWPVGEASFNAESSKGSEQRLREQAEKVGAQAVLLSTRYSHTVTSAVPLTLPNTTTSYTTGNATAYGRNGPVSAYGSSQTTTYGTQTVMVPVSQARSDFGAVFFMKGRTRIGIVPAEISDATRRKLGSNSGVMVDIVIDGSPAFRSDVLPGDLVIGVAGEPVYGIDGYVKLLEKYEGKTVAFGLMREGTAVTKDIPVQPL